MAKLITKFKYLKPSARQSVGGYAKYIATREGVEKVDDTFKTDPPTEKQKKLIAKILHDFPDSSSMLEYEDFLNEPTLGNASEFITRALEDNAHDALDTKTYADYIATRPRAERFGSHGLFTDDGVRVKLEDVSRELNEYEGNVWTVIISLRREDAERLGFNSGERWRDMLRTQTETIAKNFKIPVEDLKWYAAFHNESHHPHVHLMVYSSEQTKPYLTQKGIMNLRSAFAKDVFADDLLSIYEKQTEHRNALRAQSRDVIAEIVSRINSGAYVNPALEYKLLDLADRLSKTSGKKQYGYLKADVKAIVNGIVSDLAADERISSLYDLWYEQREEVIRTYTEELPERIPLVDNPEFKSIKNMVIQEALNISADRVIADEQDEQAEVNAETSEPETDEVEEQEYREILAVADENGGQLKNRCVFFCDEFGTLPKIESAEMMFSASRSRRLQIVPIIQSFAQLEKNYGKEGGEIIVDNTQITLFGGFAPNSSSADTLSKALGSRTVMSGSVSRSKNDPSESLQMMERPLLTPDELKSLPKGDFVVMKTGVHPMRVHLKLFFKWGIEFDKDHPYTVAENGNRKVQYANKAELMDGIVRKYHPEALLEGDVTGGGSEMEEPKQTEAKNHQPPKSNRSRSRQPKPLPDQTEKDGKKGGSQPSHKQVTVEPEPEPVPLEVSDGQA